MNVVFGDGELDFVGGLRRQAGLQTRCERQNPADEKLREREADLALASVGHGHQFLSTARKPRSSTG